MALDEAARRYGFASFRAKFHGQLAEGRVGGVRVLALKPMTYMNDSGRAVQAALEFFKLPPEAVIVIHDEIDLAAGKIKVKRGGGHAGHNGLRSLHAHIGPDYGRLRLGVGHPGDKAKVAGHVLKDFSKADNAWLEPLIDSVTEHLGLLIAGDDGRFLNDVAADINPKPVKKDDT